MGYGTVNDAWECDICLDEGVVLVSCPEAEENGGGCRQGTIIVSADGDLGLCGVCGGTGVVEEPCPVDHTVADETEPIYTGRDKVEEYDDPDLMDRRADQYERAILNEREGAR